MTKTTESTTKSTTESTVDYETYDQTDFVESEQINKTSNKKKTVKEPVPDVADEDIAEIKPEFASYEDACKEEKIIQARMKKDAARLVYIAKEKDKAHSKTAKEAKKKTRRVNTDPNKKPAGFETPTLIPERFYNFISTGLSQNKFSEEKTKELVEKNLQPDSMIPRSIITRMVYDYTKTQQLYIDKDDNKREIDADSAIRILFAMKEEEKIEFFNFQTLLCRLFPPKEKKEKKSKKSKNKKQTTIVETKKITKEKTKVNKEEVNEEEVNEEEVGEEEGGEEVNEEEGVEEGGEEEEVGEEEVDEEEEDEELEVPVKTNGKKKTSAKI